MQRIHSPDGIITSTTGVVDAEGAVAVAAHRNGKTWVGERGGGAGTQHEFRRMKDNISKK